MNNRNEFIMQLRGGTIGIVSETSSSEERFQNQTLRPILKTQNDLILAIFVDYCIKQKNVFFGLSLNKKLEYIDQSVQRDMKFREFLKGIILGFFTIDEFNNYAKNASNINKRIFTMLIERLKSQIQVIENSTLLHNNSK